MTKKYDEIYDMIINKGDVKDEHLLACLKQAFRLSMVRIDDILAAMKNEKMNFEETVYDARIGIAYALGTALAIGMNAEAQIVREMFKE